MKKIIAVLLVMITVFGACSCGGDNYAMKYGKAVISQNEYMYLLSRYKAIFLTSYLNGQDTDEVWNMPVSDNGTTIETFLMSVANENIKNNAVCLETFDRLGLKLTKEQINSVDEYIKTLITNSGSKEALNSALSEFGINSNDLKEIYLKDEKIKAVKTALFEDGAELELTDTERDDYYKTSYVRLKHIYINNAKDFARDDEGDLIIDSDTGTYKTRELSETEKAEKTALAEGIYADILSGGNFDSHMLEHTADPAMTNFPDGYYATLSSTLLPTELIEKGFSMADGEVEYIESEIGVHIIKREPLEVKAYADANKFVFFTDFEDTLMLSKLTDYLSAHSEDVLVNTAITDTFSLRTLSANYLY